MVSVRFARLDDDFTSMMCRINIPVKYQFVTTKINATLGSVDPLI